MELVFSDGSKEVMLMNSYNSQSKHKLKHGFRITSQITFNIIKLFAPSFEYCQSEEKDKFLGNFM
jgi:hypothetical protein